MEENKFHLIGIGGIGMSALARLLIAKNHIVSGSDQATQGEVLKLKEEGAEVFQGHKEGHITKKEMTVVYSTAIREDNPEIVKAKSLKCNLWHRSDLLSYLMDSSQSLAVAGTHGKTTTSAILTHVLLSTGQSPTYVIGGILSNRQTNSEKGSGKYFVLEADESDGSLLKYHPYGSILTNIEADHLDYYYKDLDHIKECFEQYISQVKQRDCFFWCKDCPNLREMNPKGFSYGFHVESDLRILSYEQRGWSLQFTIQYQGKIIRDIELSMIGEQNVLNAAAIFGLCLQLGISEEGIREAFSTFGGIKRRGERIGSLSKIDFIDDYAHHPTEVEYLLKGIRKACPRRRVIAVFQPHRYSRIKYFQKEFAAAFKKASEVILTDVYAAGEQPLAHFQEKSYIHEIEKESGIKTHYVPRDQLVEDLLKSLKPHDVVVTIGAGDVTYVGREVFSRLQKNPPKLKVGLICGGASPEHEVSLISKDYFLDRLDRSLYQPTVFKINLEGKWELEGEDSSSDDNLSPSVYKTLLNQDFIFPIVHGPQVEDGMLQGFLQTLHLPYAGPDYKCSALIMNKVWAKQVVEKEGIEVAPYLSFTQKEWSESHNKCITHIEHQLSYPLVVKPCHLGSSIEVSFVKNRQELQEAILRVFNFESYVLVEEQIFGRELEIAVLEDEKLICSSPGEIMTTRIAHSYQAKYGDDPIEKKVKADLSPSQDQLCKQIAKRIFRLTQGKGFMRIDLFLDKSGKIIFNEANPIPGCAPKSLFPKMLKESGLTESQIFDQMVVSGFYHYRTCQKQALKSRQHVESLKDATK